jgi:S1-C subfamily serine protease
VSGGKWVDVLLVVVLLAYAVSGLRRGLLQGLLSLAGFVAGGIGGLVLLPNLVETLAERGRFGRLLEPGLGRIAVVVIGVLLMAWAGQLLGSLLGRGLRGRVTSRPAQLLDRALGGVAALAAVVLLVWFVAGALRASPSPGLSRAIAQSRVVSVVDRVVPPAADRLARGFRQLIEAQGFPRVFEGLGPEVILPVDPPSNAEVGVAATAAAGGIVKITGLARSCERGQEGTGFVVAPQRVVTNAHVVAGVDEPFLRVGGEGRRYQGEVVLLDVDRDLAVIAVPELDAAPLVLGADLPRGAAAVVAGFPLDGPYTVEPARVRQVLTARGENIYGEPGVDREVYSLFADVEPGNSGGPLLDPQGRVVGVVFAKSLDDPETGYALTLRESRPVLQQASTLHQPVPVGACATR